MRPTPTFTIIEGKVIYRQSSLCLHLFVVVLFILNEFEKAAEDYTKSTELDDTFVFSHIQLAVAQYKSGEIAKSMATFRRTLKAFPDRSEPQNY
jgi:tetratricopeptide (TPR) repeat protein